MVHVYAIDISALPELEEYPSLLNGLSTERKKKISRYRQEKDRKQSIGAGLLLKQILNSQGMCEEQISYGPHGKPEIKGFYFNLSHSQDYVICAVAEKAVGCDVEMVGKARERVAERFFTEKEVEHLDSFRDSEKVQEFYRIWTLKESYMKMTGEGLSLSPERVEFVFEENVMVYRDGEKCSCFVKEYELPGYKLSVCSEDGEFAEELEVFNGVMEV